MCARGRFGRSQISGSRMPRASSFLLALVSVLVTACASAPPLPDRPETAPPSAAPVADTALPPPILPLPDPTAAGLAEARMVAEATLGRAPRAMKVVSTEGRLPGDPVAAKSAAAKDDWYGMAMLALLCARGEAPRYGPPLENYFASWLAVFEPQFNPISESQFHWVALAYAFGRPQLTAETSARAGRLFRRMAEGYLRPAGDAATRSNNWQSHRVRLAATLAFAIGDAELIERSRAAFVSQLGDNLRPDGTVADFAQRDALRYVVYSLEPLLTAALVARSHGADWYALAGGNGATLSRALRWLAPYAGGTKTHREFVRSKVPFDRQRAAAGVAGFDGLWEPAGALNSYQIAARLEPGWIPLAVWLGDTPSWLELAYPDAAVTAARAELLRNPPQR